MSTPSNSDIHEGVGRQVKAAPGRFRQPLTTAVAFVLLAAIVGGYFAFIHHYAVNSIYFDQWYDIRLLGRWYSGTMTISDLWSQHGENRILFPNLLVLLLARSAHYNTIVEQYLSGALLVASTAIIIWAHKRRSPDINWLWYVPVAAALLSLVQYQNTLWGFQLAWYMVYLSLALSLLLLDRRNLTWLALGIAIVVAIVGSYSSAQGLLIWPVGLLLLYQRNRSRSMSLTWLACAVVTAVVYFYNLSAPNAWSSVFAHPVATAKFYFLAVAGVLGVVVPQKSNADTYIVIAAGIIIFVLAVWVLFTFGRRRDETSGAPFGVALCAFGLLFAAMATSERASQGLVDQTYSHYTTFDLLIPVGCGLTLLSAWTNATQQNACGKTPSTRNQTGLRIMTPVLGIFIVLLLLSGANEGLTYVGGWSSFQQNVAGTTVNSYKLTERYDDSVLLSGCFCFWNLPQLIQIAREHRLSTFETGAAAIYQKEGLPRDTVPPKTRVSVPSSGARLSKAVPLSAEATTEIYVITRVDFLVSGNGLDGVRIARARPYIYGWLASWNTTTVANGSYLLQSVAYDAAGHSTRSVGVQIQVTNP